MDLASNPITEPCSGSVLGVERSVSGRRWCARIENDRQALLIAQRLGLPEIVGRVLAGRGVSVEEADDYLKPSLRSLLPDPSGLADLDKATERIVRAVMDGKRIALFGDYDVDGATSTALMKLYLDRVGADTCIYIPDRLREGYGPNVAALMSLAAQGVSLVITLDCGVTAFEPLAAARKQALDVVVVDHHKTGDELPPAYAVVNPKRDDDGSGCDQLAAVGLAFLLCVSLNRQLRREGWFGIRKIPEPDLLNLLDVVALGTICDVVPLVGLNRAFVTQGLKVMAARQSAGLCALCDVAGLNHRLTSDDLAFQLGPRINAGGRVGRSDLGSRLLVTADAEEAAKIAAELEALNQERKDIERDVEGKACKQIIERNLADGSVPVIVAADLSWHPGVIGIVASRLKDRFGRPCIVLSVGKDGVAKGSGRSVPGVDLGAAIVSAHRSGLLINGGGHAMAAGLTIEARKINALTEFLSESLAGQEVAREKEKTLRLDGLLSPGAVSRDLLDTIDCAGPYGAGSPEPKFAFPNVRATYTDIVGGAHVRCTLAGEDGAALRAIAFRSCDTPLGEVLLSRCGAPLHVAGFLKPDHWRGEKAVQLHISDAALPSER